ncbi:ZIP family zinc transporter [Modicisalibacter xianhensis]|uniref:ZIP family zinc transporter n=1 Tax=Modicisalibacter xianhensis TaxID=442341 RepID=A0A4R8F9H8_9GAMM|nr:hypothetical protein [Halomonas xianhensis]TDX22196.1 ZIP family zinc transporter [Halomonas xianhensis]
MLAEALLRGGVIGLIGMLSLIAGGIWSALREPSRRTRSVVQHLAAGAVFAGLTAEVLKRLLEDPSGPWIMGIGMALGLGLMLFIRSYGQSSGSGMALGFTIIADVLADGVLMGLAINSSSNPPSMVSIVFVIALIPELIFLGLTLTDEIGGDDWGKFKRIGMPGLVGIGVVVGSMLGGWASTGGDNIKTFIEAFGAVALAYLVVEELLREAHKQESNPLIAGMFFAGFIPFFIAAAIFS